MSMTRSALRPTYLLRYDLGGHAMQAQLTEEDVRIAAKGYDLLV
jgi:hypothetical protein